MDTAFLEYEDDEGNNTSVVIEYEQDDETGSIAIYSVKTEDGKDFPGFTEETRESFEEDVEIYLNDFFAPDGARREFIPGKGWRWV